MTELSKVFARERSFFYLRVWNDSGRRAFKDWAHKEPFNFLFIHRHSKMNVYYNLEEFAQVCRSLEQRIAESPEMIDQIQTILDTTWLKVAPYLEEDKPLETLEEFESFYHDIIHWWSGMEIFFEIPDLENVPLTIKDRALGYRKLVEKYSDRQDGLLVEFVEQKLPVYREWAKMLQPEEVVRLMKNVMTEEEKSQISKRKDGFALWKNTVYALKDIDTVLREDGFVMKKDEVGRAQSIKGQTASPGKATGKVRKILLKRDVSLLEAGEILVTEMTSPEYLPAMKKAAAIITDEGGVTCHAAIVSRELKIPCVVGTRIATQVLKDGDIVEVDAERGIVRVL